MKKFQAVWLLLICCIFIVAGCSDEKIQSDNVGENSDVSKEYLANMDEMYEESFKGINYMIPSDWEKVEPEDENILYYYPDEGMLMTSYVEELPSISNAKLREEFLDGMADSGIISFNEKQIEEGVYVFDSEGIIDDEIYEGELLLLDTEEGVFSFMLLVPENNYDKFSMIFNEIITSIQYTKPKKIIDPIIEDEDIVYWDEEENTFFGSDKIIKIDDIIKSKDFDGRPAIEVHFTITNNSEEVINTQMLFGLSTQVRQVSTNTSNDLRLAIMPIDSADSNLRSNINPGGTVTGYYPYLLENENDPIEISFREGFKIVETVAYDFN